MRILYFAWLRERLGRTEEELELPSNVTTVAGLVDWLSTRGPEFSDALADRGAIKVAVNQEFARDNSPVKSSDEVAIFPPVTGG